MDKTKSIWHWITAFMVALMMFTCTLSSSGFSVMVNAVKGHIGLTGTQSSMIFTIKNLSALVFVFFADKYYKKVGLRFGVFGGFLLGALAMTVFMLADKNLVMVYIAAVILGATYAFSMLLPMALIMQAWFNKSRAFAMSIASAGTGLNAFIITPMLQRIINSDGPAAAFRVIIFMFLIIGVIFVLLVRSTPAERGLEPYGGKDYAVTAKTKGSGASVPAKYTVWFIICAGLMGYAGGPTQQHFILHFNQLGYDSVMVASAYGIIGIMLIIFKLGFGTLSTKFNFGTISCVFLGFYVVSCICAAGSQFVTSPALVYGACATLGVAGAVTSLGYPNWVADTHPENYAKTAKNAQASYQGLEVLGSLMPGVLLDLTGHYTAAYILNGVIFALVAVIVFIAYSSTRKKAVSAPAAE